MKIFYGSKTVRNLKNAVVTLGVFDGVHRGHQQLFRQATREARKLRGSSVVYTFDPHPARLLVPEAAPPMITTLDQKLELIGKSGIDGVVVEKFTKAYARQSPEAFFRKILVERLAAREIIVGYDFTFGVHRSGTLTQLRALAEEEGIRLKVVPPYLWKETIVSSTQIRHRLGGGLVEKGEELLGHPYFMEGRVVRGRGIGGQLGIHTANMESTNDLILPTGVYVTLTHAEGRSWRSVTNIGPNPTFGQEQFAQGQFAQHPLSIETHLLHFDHSIVGKVIRVEFLTKIREEIVFPSPKELAVQIHNDILVAQQYFGRQGHWPKGRRPLAETTFVKG